MKTTSLFCLFIFLLSCSTPKPFDRSEIAQLSNDLSQLNLTIDYETNDLRYDIIRQTYDEQVNDSTTETHNMAYHPLGFNLGNGLFYDLNRNLSLRIDHLFSIGEAEDFTIERTDFVRKKQYKTYKTKKGNEFCFQWTGVFGKKKNDCTERIVDHKNVELFRNNKLCYRISVKDDETHFNRGKRKKPECIIKSEDDTTYRMGKLFGKREFTIDEDIVTLDKAYVIKKDPKDNSINIYSRHWQKEVLLYKIKKGDKKLFVYNQKYYGTKIESGPSNLIVYNNNYKQTELKRIN